MNYYIASIQETLLGIEFVSHFLFSCSESEVETKITDIWLNYRGSFRFLESETDTTIECGGVFIRKPFYTQIKESEFTLFKKYLAVL